MGKTKVWLDCDPGHDDAIAIILAAFGKNPNTNDTIDFLGISTVHGNATVENTTQNALKITTTCDINVDVVKGQDKPLFRPSQICPEIHGNSGLDLKSYADEKVFEWPKLNNPVDKKGILHMYDIISKQGEQEVVLCLTGCHTNAALLFLLFPEVKKFLRKIVFLGGSVGLGNMTPAAEFNILLDPESTQIIFETGLPIYMIPIEISHQALVTKEFISQIQSLKTDFAQCLVQIMTFFASTYKSQFNFEDPPLHDPLTVAYILDPSLFEFKEMRVDIECKSEMTRGATLCDVYGMSKLPRNCFLCTKCNIPAFWEMTFQAFILATQAAAKKLRN